MLSPIPDGNVLDSQHYRPIENRCSVFPLDPIQNNQKRAQTQLEVGDSYVQQIRAQRGLQNLSKMRGILIRRVRRLAGMVLR